MSLANTVNRYAQTANRHSCIEHYQRNLLCQFPVQVDLRELELIHTARQRFPGRMPAEEETNRRATELAAKQRCGDEGNDSQCRSSSSIKNCNRRLLDPPGADRDKASGSGPNALDRLS